MRPAACPLRSSTVRAVPRRAWPAWASAAGAPVAGPRLTEPPCSPRACPPVSAAYGILKKCAAKYNVREGLLDSRVGGAIMDVSDEVTAGKLDDHFPLVRALARRARPRACGGA